MRRILPSISLIGLVLLAAPVLAQPRPVSTGSPGVRAAEQVPRFEDAPCAIEVPAAEVAKVRCGYLVVPENRPRKNSRSIRLPVIIQKSSSPTPAPDPVLRTLGGPGASSLRIVSGRRSSPWLAQRDVIVFEQRGTKFAQPSLNCPEVPRARAESRRANLDERTTTRHIVSAARICRDRLVGEGVDLAGYNSTQSAADIEDLRRVLGYEQWNLYGVSYSARLMLEVMRDHPAGIRSVAIESVLPPEANYDEAGVDAAMRALQAVFSNCAGDADCAKAYPNLEQIFDRVRKRANRKPVEFSVKVADAASPLIIKLNGDDITTWILDYLLSADAAAAADTPLQIFRFDRGDYRALQPYAEEVAQADTSYALGMRYSFWCSEEMPFENRRKIAAQSIRHPILRGYSSQPEMPGVCGVWRVPRLPSRANRQVTSNIPTLVLGAEYDAYTPPDWGRAAGRSLSNSFFFTVPAVGHGPGFSSACARQIVAEFFNRPERPPAGDCLGAGRPRFATEAGQ